MTGGINKSLPLQECWGPLQLPPTDISWPLFVQQSHSLLEHVESENGKHHHIQSTAEGNFRSPDTDPSVNPHSRFPLVVGASPKAKQLGIDHVRLCGPS